MRKLLLAAAFVASAAAANAQATFGVKAGLNVSSIKTKAGDESETSDSKVGFNVGGFANVPLSTNFSFAPELVVSTEGGVDKGDEWEEKTNLTYVNVPVLFQYNASGFFAHTGPQVGFLLAAKSKWEEDGEKGDEDIKKYMKGVNFSWAIGAGYKLPSGLGFNARYNLGLSNIADTESDDDDYSAKASTIQVGITYTLGK
ncbi:MAG TPA: porin family protein [Flavisolibacter sp.]|nr:porin family protein [Flavisolibacter sp.]